MSANLRKPAFGSPCNGCGVCCLARPCPVANSFIGAHEGACPALEYEQGRYWCGMLRNAHRYMPGMAEKPFVSPVIADMLMAIGAWRGVCDSE